MTTPVHAAQPDKSKLYSDPSVRPAMLAPVWDEIPVTLRSLSQWIAWELRWVDKRSCWAKVPIDVRGMSATDGYARAKSDTPRTWTTLATVRAAWGRTYGTYTPRDPDGPGLVFNGGGLVGIDGDKCRNPVTGEITPFGLDLMARFPGYWEVSPSGTGIKGVFNGTLADGRGRKFDYPEGHGVEVYDRGRYFAITGRRVDGAAADVTSIAEQLPAFVAEIDQLKAARKPAKPQRAKPAADYSTNSSAGPVDASERTRRARLYIAHRPGAVAYQGGDNHTFGTACELVLGFDLTPSQALPVLREWNETCSPPWPDEWLWRKLTEADKQPGPRGYILNAPRPGYQPRALGYENLSDAERDELIKGLGCSIATDLAQQQPVTPTAEPEDCAVFAAQDVEDEINLCGLKCPNLCPVIMSKDDRPFVCERWCGNGTTCRACLFRRLYDRTRESNAYLVRTSVATGGPDNPPRVVVAALVDASVAPGTTRWGTLTNAVRDRGGERASILTGDATGTAERLGRDPAASRFFLKEKKVEGESGPARLWLLSMPAGTPDELELAGVSFRRVPVANAIRGWHHAVKTVPQATPGKVFKPWHKSLGWGDEAPQEPTTVKALRPSKFGVARTRKILDLISVEAYSVQFDRRNGSDPGVGWALNGARSLAMEVWLGGVGATETLTVSRVVELARHWLPLIPADIGAGHRVMRVLSEHIWACALYDVTADLRAADEQDRAEAAALSEASQLYSSLRDTYRGREHELTGLLAELLA